MRRLLLCFCSYRQLKNLYYIRGFTPNRASSGGAAASCLGYTAPKKHRSSGELSATLFPI